MTIKTYSLSPSSGCTYTVPTSGISYTPAEHRQKQINKYRADNKYNIYWDEEMSDRQVEQMMEFLDTKLDVMPVKKQEEFLDAELFEL